MCAILAKQKGFSHFALLNSECWSSYRTSQIPVYGSYKPINDCGDTDGKGGATTYAVYQIPDEGEDFVSYFILLQQMMMQ